MTLHPGLEPMELAALVDRTPIARDLPVPVKPAPMERPASAIEQTRRFDDGSISAAELLEASLARADAAAALNAFATLSRDRARHEAAALDRAREGGTPRAPLAGVPVAHKDILLTKGLRTAAGSALLAGYAPELDARAVQQLAAAGAVCVGKLNTHEFATGVTGTVSADGPTLNPWDPERVPGGSSCGSAAAVAAGVVAVATGTDTGGSIRVPPACCGVVGFKPTYDSVSRRGAVPFAVSLDHVGAIGRTVTDVARAMECLFSADARPRLHGAPIDACDDTGLAGVRFAAPESLLQLADAPVADAVRAACGVLQRLGAEHVEVALPALMDDIAHIAVPIFLAEGGAFHAATLASHAQHYQPATRTFLGRAAGVPATRYVRARQAQARLRLELSRLLQGVDLLVCPTLPLIAPRVSAEHVELPTGVIDVRAALTTYTRPFNLAGLPALSLPCGFDDAMPIGLQLIGPAWHDRRVLYAAREFQRATDWLRWPGNPAC